MKETIHTEQVYLFFYKKGVQNVTIKNDNTLTQKHDNTTTPHH